MVPDGYLVVPYVGHIYIDVIYSENDQDRTKLITCMENTDGTMHYIDATLYCLTLKAACENAHQGKLVLGENIYI